MATITDKILIALSIDARGMQTGADEAGDQIDRVKKKVDEAKKKLKDVGQSVDDFGKKAGQVLLQFVAPVLAAVSVGKMIGGYFSDVAAVAEATGAYNKTLEETRLKKAQLQRISKDDIEFYKKSREALVKFNIAMGDFVAAAMRSVMPAMEKMIGWLGKVSDWVSRNPDNIIRFMRVLGAVVGTVLIPVFVRWAAVLLANPITWIVGLVLALALAIDDLVVYLKGGRSSLDALWKSMGLVKGDTETLNRLMGWLKDTGLSLAKALGVLLTAFTAFKVVTGIINGVKIAWTAFTASVWANPIILAIGLLIAAGWMLYKNWDEVCEGAEALWEDLCNTVSHAWDATVNAVSHGFEYLAGAWDSIVNSASHAIGGIADAWDGLIDATSRVMGSIIDTCASGISAAKSAIADKAAAAGDAISTAFSAAGDAVSGVWQGMKDGASALADDAVSALSTLWQGMKDGAGAAVGSVHSAFDGIGSWFNTKWTEMREGASAVFDSLKTFAGGAWSDIKGSASALVDDIESVFSGLTSWFSNLWGKITGIFGSALDGIKSGLGSVADFLGIGGGDSKKQGNTGLSPEQFEKQKTEILKKRQAREAQGAQPTARTSAAPVSRPAPITVQIQQAKMAVTPMALGMGRAQAVRAPAVNSSTISNIRNSSTSSTVNDNRRQEVNITVNGNADSRTAQQIGTNVTDVFKSGAMSPVAG